MGTDGDGYLVERQPFAPDTLLVLDFIEFVHASVAKPISGKYHNFFSRHHLTFDQEAGQEDFRATVNRIFARNGVAFEMLPYGRIERVLPPVLGEELKRSSGSGAAPSGRYRAPPSTDRSWPGCRRQKSTADTSSEWGVSGSRMDRPRRFREFGFRRIAASSRRFGGLALSLRRFRSSGSRSS